MNKSSLRSTCTARILPVAATAILLFASLTLPSHAQLSAAPVAVSGPTFARTSTRFYIQGGNDANSGQTINVGQFFYLDLSIPWNVTSPAWNQLNDGPQQNIYPSVFSADQKSMITFHLPGTPFAYRYSVTSGQWSASSLNVAYGAYQGVNAVTDPDTGLVYLAGSYTDPSRNSMDIYSFATDTIVSNALPNASVVFAARSYYSNVWTRKRNSILYFGGYNSTLQQIPNGNVITEFVPSSQQWSTMTTTGTGPSMRADHCMASNDDGSVMIIYGGRLLNNTFSGEIFMFDTVKQVWTQGNSGPVRIYTACTIAGDQFLAWGGVDSTSNIAAATILIYNITGGNWATQYVPPASYIANVTVTSTATASPTDGSTTPPSSSSHSGAIAGGAVAGIAVICAGVLFFLFRRRRQHRAAPVQTTSDHDDAAFKDPSISDQGEELHRMRVQLHNQQEQLELQRRLLQLQQQQQQLNLPVQQPQYQDATYNYQPPIVYSPSGSSNPVTVTSLGMDPNSSPDSIKALAPSSGLAHSGYIDGNNQYAVTHAATPTIYTPAVAKHESSYWDQRRGNPHALIET
ncbi:hypothetical protein EDD21DRAFT_362729 [Dissophora ornata]|nr:hypothetical protein BGZ58_007003 [Dissophora ornata]KAI8605791.1 hypothetical protein EDD21DRAFT_362729 [Dissophora ornata]